jgi:hypothetical protein
VPDIFNRPGDNNSERYELELRALLNILCEEGLVRDLREGQWSEYIEKKFLPLGETSESDPTRERKIFEKLYQKLKQENRLRPTSPATGENPPSNDIEWCQEAIASHKDQELTAIIASDAVQQDPKFKRNKQLIKSVDQFLMSWWQNRSSTVRLERTTKEYLKHLQLLLSHANKIMFIDPYLDPTRYSEFGKLLEAIAMNRNNRMPRPRIQIHQVHYVSLEDTKKNFQSLSDILNRNNLTIEVFIWTDDFHDRYLISDIVGILLSNGFNCKNGQKTTWARLSRLHRQEIEKEFDPAVSIRKPMHQFQVP